MWGTSLLKSWSSTETTVSISSAEAELYALSRCAQQAFSLTSLAADFGLSLSPIIHTDASAALGIAYLRGLGGRTRHVQAQYLWIQGAVQREEIKMKKVASRENPSNALTKFVSGELLLRHTQWFRYSYPGQHDGQEDVTCTVEQQRLQCFAKHLSLARQQHERLTHALCEGNGLDSWGGNDDGVPSLGRRSETVEKPEVDRNPATG